MGQRGTRRACAVACWCIGTCCSMHGVMPAYEFRRGFCTLVLSLSCVSVYPSVPALAASASVETSKQRYSRVSLRLFLDEYVWSFEKTFR